MAQAQRQKLPYKEKDKSWREGNVAYYRQRCFPNNLYFQSLYRAANGELEATEYQYMVNPFGNAVRNRPQLQSYPAKLRNYPIIPEIVNKLIGEKRDRPILSFVSITNADVMTKKKAEEARILKQFLEQTYINELNALGVDTGKESMPQDPIEEILHEFNVKYTDPRAIVGQEVLDYIMMDCDVPEKFIQGFKHWIITSCVYTLKDVVNEDVVYRTLNPQYVGFIADDSTDFIEDAEAAVVTEQITKASFMDRYYSIIKEEDEEKYEEILNYVDNPAKYGSDPRVLIYGYTDRIEGNTIYSGPYDNYQDGRNYSPWIGEVVQVTYVNWMSWKLLREVAIINDLGEIEIIDVPEDYKVQEEFGETLVSEVWIKEAWEGYCVGGTGDFTQGNTIYFGIKPIPTQRNRINNKAACKLLINGRIKKIGNRKQLSYVELLMPFQHLYNFGHYKLNNIMAKNKDKMLLMPIGLIPNRDGWDEFTTMYYADATSVLWVDESNDQTKQAINAIKAIDMGLGQYVQFMFEYLREIKAEAYQVIGFSPQRMADISKSEGLGTSTSAIKMSYMISEDVFAEYDKFQERELNGLLDISRFAYINGKKAAYINSVGRQIFLQIDAENADFANSEFQVFVVNSSKEKEKFDKMKGLAETFASQGAKFSTLGQVLHAESSFEKLLSKLEQIEAQEQALQQQAQQSQQEAQKYIEDQKAAIEKAKMDLEYYRIDKETDTQKEIALIKADVETLGMDMNANAIPDNVEIEKNAIAREKTFADLNAKYSEHRIKSEELRIKEEESKRRAETEKYKADTDLKIAKENRTAAEIKADKNKNKKKD